MPYILPKDRELYDTMINDLFIQLGANPDPGHMNYVLTRLVVLIFTNNKSYRTANDIMGVLTGVLQEFYRVEVAPYEEEKRKQNGEIRR